MRFKLNELFSPSDVFRGNKCDACLSDTDCGDCPGCEDGNIDTIIPHPLTDTLGQCKCLIDESAGVCEIRDLHVNSIEKITDTMYVI